MLSTAIILLSIAVICLIVIVIFRKHDCAESIQIIAGLTGITFLLFGIWCLCEGLTRRTSDITIHFLESDTYVTYENAYAYRSYGSQYVITEDGNKIQVVNAEIIRDAGD